MEEESSALHQGQKTVEEDKRLIPSPPIGMTYGSDQHRGRAAEKDASSKNNVLR